MNLFKLDFIQGKTDAANYGAVVHSLTDADGDRKIMTLTLSSDKLQGVSKYSREPKRLNFECFVDAWIEEYILSGDYEHERYISHYEVAAYRDEVQIFRGIVDTSNLNYDEAEGIISFTCYDKIKYLSLYNDLVMLYSLTGGYLPYQLLGLFIQKIGQRIPVSISYSGSGLEIPSMVVAEEDAIEMGTCNLQVMNTLPADGGGWQHNWIGAWAAPRYGYVIDVLSHMTYFIVSNRMEIEGRMYMGQDPFTHEDIYNSRYKARYYGRIIKILNHTAISSAEYNEEADWKDTQYTDDDDAEQRWYKFFTERGFDQADYGDWESAAGLGDTNYNCSYANNIVSCYLWGELVPDKLQPGAFYDTLNAADTANCLKVLQAMLLMCNATLMANTGGTIELKSKDQAGSEPVIISNNDVVSLQHTRIKPEVPDTSIMEALAGDTRIMQEALKNYLLDFYSGKWQANITIDRIDQYEIELGSTVQINGTDYQVVEVQRDWVADDYKIRAWRL